METQGQVENMTGRAHTRSVCGSHTILRCCGSSKQNLINSNSISLHAKWNAKRLILAKRTSVHTFHPVRLLYGLDLAWQLNIE